LTGERLYHGETVTDVIAAVITRDPDWEKLPKSTPRSVRRVLQRCLQKDPRKRLRDIGDAALELDLSRYLHTIRMGKFNPILQVRGRFGAVGDALREDPLGPRYGEVASLRGAVWDTIDVSPTSQVLVPVPRQLESYPTESNELFRLGGTTFHPLRGYDDFEIVPDDNVVNRFDVFETSQNDTVIGYSVVPGQVFYPGGRYMMAFNFEWGFSVFNPLHALFFFDVGGTWNEVKDFRMDSLHKGAGVGFRMEVPLLGLIGFDYGYGFDRLDRLTGRYDRKGWEPHIQFGRIF